MKNPGRWAMERSPRPHFFRHNPHEANPQRPAVASSLPEIARNLTRANHGLSL
jgi:hypothetical protein